MQDFIINNAVLVTAILSLIGVSFAAILNYISNIRVNKAKIEHEARKNRQSFLNEAFVYLREAAKELRDMKVSGNEKKVMELIADYNIKAIEIFDSIKPFISTDKRLKLEANYQELQDRMSAIRLKQMEQNRLSDEDIENAREIAVQETHLRFELQRIIDEEISIIAEKLRQFDM